MNLFDLIVEQTSDCDSGEDDETIIADYSTTPKTGMNTNICYSILYQFYSFMEERYTPSDGDKDINCDLAKIYIETFKDFQGLLIGIKDSTEYSESGSFLQAVQDSVTANMNSVKNVHDELTVNDL